MNFTKLLEYIETLTSEQLAMPVVVLIDNTYHHLSAAMHVDKDFRDPNTEEEFEPYAEDQPVLT